MPCNRNEYKNNGKILKDATYKRHNGQTVAAYKNVSHLNEDKKHQLTDLTSQFPEPMKGTVGDYKNMEAAFELDHSQHPCDAKPYRIPVLQIKLMKMAINVMVENGALSEYNGSSPWAAPTFGVPKKNDKV